MKYFVRTTGSRDLKAYDFLNYEPLFDYKHEPINSFIEQMQYISKYNAIMLEDDLIFCKDFENEIEKAIKRYPDKVINFFYMYLQFMPTRTIKGKMFLNNQCVYYPKGVAGKIAKEMKRIVESGTTETQYDRIEAQAMHNLGIDFVSYRPMLVQHIGGGKSLLGNEWINDGKSIFFKDDLPCDYDDFKSMLDYAYKKYDELGISYTRPKIISKK